MCLYTENEEETIRIKICDFGFACYYKADQMLNIDCGTPFYMAPEIHRGMDYDRRVDVWSVGIMTYEMLCGKPPFAVKGMDLNALRRATA